MLDIYRALSLLHSWLLVKSEETKKKCNERSAAVQRVLS